MQEDLESKCMGKMQMFHAEKFQMFLHVSLALHLYVGPVIPNSVHLDAAPFGILGPGGLSLHCFAGQNRFLAQHKDSKRCCIQMHEHLEYFFHLESVYL